MKIEFKGKANKPEIMINTLVMLDAENNEVVIDRDTTEYNPFEISYGVLDMLWRGCYIWDGDNPRYITEKDRPFLESLRFKELELEDDAGADYTVEITSVDFLW